MDKLKQIENIKAAYRDVFNTESGQKVLEDLERKSYIRFTTFSKDPYEMAYREGIRAAFLYIKAMLKQKEA